MIRKMNTKELFAALEMLEKEKGIPMDYMIENIEKGIEVACKNYYGGNDEVVFKILPDKNVFDVRLKKTVVEEVFDPDYEISLEDAQKILKRKAINIDDKVAIPLDPKDLGRIAIGAARNTIRQGIRTGEKGQTLSEFKSKLGELVTATVERIDPKSGAAVIRIGKSEAMLKTLLKDFLSRKYLKFSTGLLKSNRFPVRQVQEPKWLLSAKIPTLTP